MILRDAPSNSGSRAVRSGMRTLPVAGLAVSAVACGSPSNSDQPPQTQSDSPRASEPGSATAKPGPLEPRPDTEPVAKAFFGAETAAAATQIDWEHAARTKALTDLAEGITVADAAGEKPEAGVQPFAIRLPLAVIAKVKVESLAADDRALFDKTWKRPDRCEVGAAKAPLLPVLAADILAGLPAPYQQTYALARAGDDFVADCGEQVLHATVADGKIVNFTRATETDPEFNVDLAP